MTPSVSSDCIRQCTCVDAVSFGELGNIPTGPARAISLPKAPRLNHDFVSQNANRGRFSDLEPGASPSVLPPHVVGIVLACAKEQVSRSHAEFHVTMMTDQKAMLDRASPEYPYHPVGKHRFTMTEGKRAISIRESTAEPQPAARGLFDLPPKALSNVFVYQAKEL